MCSSVSFFWLPCAYIKSHLYFPQGMQRESFLFLLSRWPLLSRWVWSIEERVGVLTDLLVCDLSCDSLWERKCVVNVLTWLSCFAALRSAGRVIQVLECKVPIELWKWELSREMGIAPCWFVTFAMLCGAFSVCTHLLFNRCGCMCVLHACLCAYIIW